MLVRLIFALLFVGWVGEAPVEVDSVTYSGLWRSPFEAFAPLFMPIPGIRIVAWQLLLLVLLPVAAASGGSARQRPKELETAMLISVACIAVTFAWGLLRGGSAYYAYFQLWRFLAALAVAYVLASTLRTRGELRTIAALIIAAAIIRGALVMWFYWNHVQGRMYPPPEYMTNHDDSLLFVTAILAAGCHAAIERRRSLWLGAAVLTVFLFYAMVLNARRLAWVELAFALGVVYYMIGPSPLRDRIHRWALVVVPLALLYVVVGWGQEGALFAPVKALSTTGSDRDASSLARLEEIRNLLHTLTAGGNPLLGTGWGLPYQKLSSVYANYSAEWVLALYTPHNSLLGVAAFSGLVGLLGIWCVVPVGAYLAARSYHRTPDPVLRTTAMVSLGVLAAYGVHCYGDIGFQSFPCGLLLGIALASAGKVSVWTARQPVTGSAAPSATVPPPLRGASAPALRAPSPIVGRGLPGARSASVTAKRPQGKGLSREPDRVASSAGGHPRASSSGRGRRGS
jgi:hypothetical protein